MKHAWGNTLDLKSELREQEQEQENETVKTKKAPLREGPNSMQSSCNTQAVLALLMNDFG